MVLFTVNGERCQFADRQISSLGRLASHVFGCTTETSTGDLSFVVNRRPLLGEARDAWQDVPVDQYDVVDIRLRGATIGLCGGKGGFGSMLRSIGAQIEKTTNRDACRDLSGRRLRDVEMARDRQQLAAANAARDVEREHKRAERLRQLARISSGEATTSGQVVDSEGGSRGKKRKSRAPEPGDVFEALEQADANVKTAAEMAASDAQQPATRQSSARKSSILAGLDIDSDDLSSSSGESESDERDDASDDAPKRRKVAATK